MYEERETMRYLVIGSGGREHALAWALKNSGGDRAEIFAWPGNPGTAQLGENIVLSKGEDIVTAAKKRDISVAVIGPEDKLVEGLADAFEFVDISAVGCSEDASILESSKIFSKRLMHQNGIPTAVGWPCYDIESAVALVRGTDWGTKPLVIKADGLCGGKGVLLPKSADEAVANLKELMVDRKFGEAGKHLVLEARLSGPEVSVMAIVDVNGYYALLPTSGDHKRRFENDEGLNTGGMGAYAPSPYVDEKMLGVIRDRIIEPTIRAMNKEGIPFTGILYAGLMLTKEGPKVMEFNVRPGDPETQPQMLLVENLAELFQAYKDGDLKSVQPTIRPGYACCTVVVTKGYPGNMDGQKEHLITGIEDAEKAGAVVFHAGTKRTDKGVLVNSGGRVLGVTMHADTLEEAAILSGFCASKIRFGEYAAFRREIGKTAYEYIKSQQKRD
jgi:phosphoribosylamine--glycine ligase